MVTFVMRWGIFFFFLVMHCFFYLACLDLPTFLSCLVLVSSTATLPCCNLKHYKDWYCLSIKIVFLHVTCFGKKFSSLFLREGFCVEVILS